jgi:pilus assembly protein CpaF
MSLELWDDLKRWVRSRRNLLVAGGAGTGKTSLLRLLAEQCGSDERLITIEDVRELNLRHPHVVSLEAHRQHTLHTLMLNALRMRPDRIIVGEVRGDEALELVEAMQTGHPGSLSTVHSQAPDMRTIYRLARMCVKGNAGIPFDALVEQMTATIEIIVYMKRYADGSRRIDAVTQVMPSGLFPLWKYDGYGFVKMGDYVDG